MKSKRKKQIEEVEQQEEGEDLCAKCGNMMIEENGKMVCSSCADDLDFFGEDHEGQELGSKINKKE